MFTSSKICSLPLCLRRINGHYRFQTTKAILLIVGRSAWPTIERLACSRRTNLRSPLFCQSERHLEKPVQAILVAVNPIAWMTSSLKQTKRPLHHSGPLSKKLRKTAMQPGIFSLAQSQLGPVVYVLVGSSWASKSFSPLSSRPISSATHALRSRQQSTALTRLLFPLAEKHLRTDTMNLRN